MITTIIAGIATAATLVSNIKEMTSIIPKAPDSLTEKHRWMTVTIHNETQYSLVYMGYWFDSGRFFDAPTNVRPYESMTFSVCSKDGSILTGVTGGARFELRMPEEGGGYQSLDIAVGFARPQIGSIKSSVIYSRVPKKAYEVVTNKGTRHTSSMFSGTNVEGGQATMNFKAVATPGQGGSVTITQQILKEVIP
jgi:hypothetical protein